MGLAYSNILLRGSTNNWLFKIKADFFLPLKDEYKAEGIGWYDVSYVDNSSCLDLIHGKPTGLFQLLDEESG